MKKIFIIVITVLMCFMGMNCYASEVSYSWVICNADRVLGKGTINFKTKLLSGDFYGTWDFEVNQDPVIVNLEEYKHLMSFLKFSKDNKNSKLIGRVTNEKDLFLNFCPDCDDFNLIMYDGKISDDKIDGKMKLDLYLGTKFIGYFKAEKNNR